MKSSEMNDEMRLAFEIGIDSIGYDVDIWWNGEEWFKEEEEEDPESPVAGSESEEE